MYTFSLVFLHATWPMAWRCLVIFLPRGPWPGEFVVQRRLPSPGCLGPGGSSPARGGPLGPCLRGWLAMFAHPFLGLFLIGNSASPFQPPPGPPASYRRWALGGCNLLKFVIRAASRRDKVADAVQFLIRYCSLFRCCLSLGAIGARIVRHE